MAAIITRKSAGYIIATVLGVGYCPKASGTAGSLVALPLGYVTLHFLGVWGLFALLVLVYVAGTIASKEVLKYTEHDPSIIVIDEVLGQLIPLFFATTLFHYAVAFVLFRFFDITKVFPANYFDKKVLNAHGVMLDDLVAGVYAAAVLCLIKCVLK